MTHPGRNGDHAGMTTTATTAGARRWSPVALRPPELAVRPVLWLTALTVVLIVGSVGPAATPTQSEWLPFVARARALPALAAAAAPLVAAWSPRRAGVLVLAALSLQVISGAWALGSFVALVATTSVVTRRDAPLGRLVAFAGAGVCLLGGVLSTTVLPPLSDGAKLSGSLTERLVHGAMYAIWPLVSGAVAGYRPPYFAAKAGQWRALAKRSPLLAVEVAVVLAVAGLQVLLVLPAATPFGPLGTQDSTRGAILLFVVLSQVTALAMAPWRPRPALLLAALACLAGAVADPPVVVSTMVLLALGYAVGRSHPLATATLLVLVPLPWWIGGITRLGHWDMVAQHPSEVIGVVFDGALLPLLAVVAAVVVTGQRTALAARDEADRRTARADELSAVSTERARLARELHDVVAHHVSLVAVRAETAPYVVADLPAGARAAFADIAAASREAMDELRLILGVLRRADGTTPELLPQPTINDLPGLVEQFRAAGVPVELHTSAVDDVPPACSLAAFRVVQESLTNACRHAPGSRINVQVTSDGQALTVQVDDEGGAQPDRSAPAGPGFGLVGMRERVVALGGTLTAQLAGDGWQVRAVLPLTPTP